MNLSHRLIDVFRAMVTTGHVTRAAELLHTSQPTVSRDLARLEQVTGLKLFDRTGGRLQATAQALLLFEEVQRSFVGLDQIAATAASLRQFGEGRLVVVSLPALAHSLLPRAAARFHAEVPGVSLSLQSLESPLLEEWLTAQRCDLGLVEHLDPLPDVRVSLLAEVDEVVLLPDGHRLLAQAVLTPQDCAAETFISYSPPDPYRRTIDQIFALQGVERRLLIEANSAATLTALVRQRAGIAIVNPFTALEFAGQGVQWRALSVSIPFRVALAHPLRRPSSPLVAQFVACLRSEAQAIMGVMQQG